MITTLNSRHLAVLTLGIMFQVASAATYYSDPAAGTAAGDGSATAPWPKLQELADGGKLARLHGGDTLLLRSGNHGNVRFGGDNATVVTIAAAPGQKPQLGRLTITAGSNWRVKGLTISPSFSPQPYQGNIVTLAEGGASRELVLEDCFIHTAPDSTKWTAEDWIKANSGVMLGRHGSNLTLRNHYILNTRFGVSLCSPDSLCEGNIVTNFSGDGIRITRDNITVQYNTVRNCFVGPDQGDDNHDDLMQCFLFNNEKQHGLQLQPEGGPRSDPGRQHPRGRGPLQPATEGTGGRDQPPVRGVSSGRRAFPAWRANPWGSGSGGCTMMIGPGERRPQWWSGAFAAQQGIGESAAVTRTQPNPIQCLLRHLF